MCDDVQATVRELEAKGVRFTRPVSDEGFGLMTALELPDGSSWASTSHDIPPLAEPARPGGGGVAAVGGGRR
jgi:hypothetical protein